MIFAGLPARVAHLLDPGPAQWHLDGTGFVPSYVSGVGSGERNKTSLRTE